MWKRQGDETKEFKRGTTGLVNGTRISKKMAVGLGVMMGLIITSAIVVPITVIAATTTSDREIAKELNAQLAKIPSKPVTTMENRFIEEFPRTVGSAKPHSNGSAFGVDIKLDLPRGATEEWSVMEHDYANELLEVRIKLQHSVDKASATVYKDVKIAGFKSNIKVANDYINELKAVNIPVTESPHQRSIKTGTEIIDYIAQANNSGGVFTISELNAMFSSPIIDTASIVDTDNSYRNIIVFVDSVVEEERFENEAAGLGKQFRVTIKAKNHISSLPNNNLSTETLSFSINSLDRHTAGDMIDKLDEYMRDFETKLPENMDIISSKNGSTLNSFFVNNPTPQPYQLVTDSNDSPNMETQLGIASRNLVKFIDKADSCNITFSKITSSPNTLNIRFEILVKIQYSNSNTYVRTVAFTLVSTGL